MYTLMLHMCTPLQTLYYNSSNPCSAVLLLGCDLSLAFLASLLCFNKSLRGSLVSSSTVPPQFAHTFPLLLLAYTAQTLLLPWHSTRKVVGLLLTVATAPFGRVRFAEAVVGDVLTSVVRVSLDLVFALAYVAVGARSWLSASAADDLTQDAVGSSWLFSAVLAPVLTVAPLWLRFLQSLRRAYDTNTRLPHLLNALKYAAALSVSLFGAFRPGVHSSAAWVLAFVGATLYQFVWDLCVGKCVF
jgi:EXS family